MKKNEYNNLDKYHKYTLRVLHRLLTEFKLHVENDDFEYPSDIPHGIIDKSCHDYTSNADKLCYVEWTKHEEWVEKWWADNASLGDIVDTYFYQCLDAKVREELDEAIGRYAWNPDLEEWLGEYGKAECADMFRILIEDIPVDGVTFKEAPNVMYIKLPVFTRDELLALGSMVKAQFPYGNDKDDIKILTSNNHKDGTNANAIFFEKLPHHTMDVYREEPGRPDFVKHTLRVHDKDEAIYCVYLMDPYEGMRIDTLFRSMSDIWRKSNYNLHPKFWIDLGDKGGFVQYDWTQEEKGVMLTRIANFANHLSEQSSIRMIPEYIRKIKADLEELKGCKDPLVETLEHYIKVLEDEEMTYEDKINSLGGYNAYQKDIRNLKREFRNKR